MWCTALESVDSVNANIHSSLGRRDNDSAHDFITAGTERLYPVLLFCLDFLFFFFRGFRSHGNVQGSLKDTTMNYPKIWRGVQLISRIYCEHENTIDLVLADKMADAAEINDSFRIINIIIVHSFLSYSSCGTSY